MPFHFHFLVERFIPQEVTQFQSSTALPSGKKDTEANSSFQMLCLNCRTIKIIYIQPTHGGNEMIKI